MVRLEMSDGQALRAIQDLQRAVVLLDCCTKQIDDAPLRAACLGVSLALTRLWEAIDDASLGLEAPLKGKRR